MQLLKSLSKTTFPNLSRKNVFWPANDTGISKYPEHHSALPNAAAEEE